MANNYDKRNYCYTYLLTNPRPKKNPDKCEHLLPFVSTNTDVMS